MTDEPIPMGRAELEKLGAAVWGATWKNDLVTHFNIRRTRLAQWLKEDAVAPWAARQLRAMGRFPPPPADLEGDALFEAGAALMREKLDQLAQNAAGAGWEWLDVVDMVAEWLDGQTGHHQHVGTPIVESDPPVVASGPIAP